MSLGKLQNIGPKLARRLNAIGINNREDLARCGAAKAFISLQQEYATERLPVCYYLYSLHAALKDCDWRTLTDTQKQKLLDEVSRLQKR